ncbi:MAG: helix-turn-helix domain-containing protein, partial [Pseudomonadota bacterium]
MTIGLDAEAPLAAWPDGAGRRDAVLEAAAELFADRGYDAVTMRQVAQAAGMLSGSLHHHFPSKDALFAEVQARALAALEAQVAGAAAAQSGPWARLGAALGAHIRGVEGARAALHAPAPARREALARRLSARRQDYEARIEALVAE